MSNVVSDAKREGKGPMAPAPMRRTMRRCAAFVLTAVSFGVGLVHAAQTEGSASEGSTSPAVEESGSNHRSPVEAEPQALAAGQRSNIAEAIEAGQVLEGMSAEQVTLARGAPARKEVIPPDAELWHYADGEVAFSKGAVSYVGLSVPPVRETQSRRSPADEAAPAGADASAAAGAKRPSSDTARVNTPGDGFLALRSEPTTRRGKRLLKIPHGTVLTLGDCVTRPGDGRWCRASFQGEIGWVFDRYLVR